jgi:hypothetical protein
MDDNIEATNEDIEDTIVVRPRRTTIDPTIDRRTTTSDNEATEEPTTRYPTRDRRGPKRYMCEDVVGRGSEQYLLGKLSTIA